MFLYNFLKLLPVIVTVGWAAYEDVRTKYVGDEKIISIIIAAILVRIAFFRDYILLSALASVFFFFSLRAFYVMGYIGEADVFIFSALFFVSLGVFPFYTFASALFLSAGCWLFLITMWRLLKNDNINNKRAVASIILLILSVSYLVARNIFVTGIVAAVAASALNRVHIVEESPSNLIDLDGFFLAEPVKVGNGRVLKGLLTVEKAKEIQLAVKKGNFAKDKKIKLYAPAPLVPLFFIFTILCCLL